MHQSLQEKVRRTLNRAKTPGSGEAGHAQRIPDAITEIAKHVDALEQRIADLERKRD
ncbi:MAG: hypothetical protein ACTHKT_08970 [Solirubrobacterales bacterium]